MKNHLIIVLLLLLSIAFFSCEKDDNPSGTVDSPTEASFAVFSDAHYYDASLGTTGAAFETYLSQDRKLLAESDAILQTVISSLSSEKLDFVLISGDLTKDGELSGHQKVAAYLKNLEASGKKVYVVPGNHDINNIHAMKFNGSTTERVSTITPAEFQQIYADFGYSEATEKDPNSLSYVAEPTKGITLIAMDACRYKENVEGPITGGKFSAETFDWIKKKIKAAKSNGKLVIGMMHHNIVEHYAGQNNLISDYLVDDFPNVSQQFAEAGMNIIFTGHYHAQDIVLKPINSGTYLYDIETGSLVTYPNPYRIVKLSESNKLTINSFKVQSINYNTNGKTFQDYSKNFIETGVKKIIMDNLMNNFGMSETPATFLAAYSAAAFIAHCQGDETLSSDTKLIIQTFSASSDGNIKKAASAMESMLTDLPPKDNNIIINLTTGEATNTSLLKNVYTAAF